MAPMTPYDTMPEGQVEGSVAFPVKGIVIDNNAFRHVSGVVLV